MSAKKSGSESSKITYSTSGVEGETRLRELILYISDKCFDDLTFGLSKLNKILYVADFESYVRFGQPITGVEYIRLPQGPAPRRIKETLMEMEAQGLIVLRKRSIYDHKQSRVIPTREANLDLFTSKHISLLDDIIRQSWGETAGALSTRSKGIAWKTAKDHARIPYEAALLSDEELTDDDITRANELIERYGIDQ
jgi:hypothetical protein